MANINVNDFIDHLTAIENENMEVILDALKDYVFYLTLDGVVTVDNMLIDQKEKFRQKLEMKHQEKDFFKKFKNVK